MTAAMNVQPFARTLEQELNALLRGASLECLVCGEFVMHAREGVVFYIRSLDLDTSNTLRSSEKSPITGLNGELFDRGDRKCVSITVAAESYSFGNAPRREICPVKRFQFDRTGKLFLQRADDGVVRERPVA